MNLNLQLKLNLYPPRSISLFCLYHPTPPHPLICDACRRSARISVQLFSTHAAPFKSDAAPWCLYWSIHIYVAPLCMLLLCAARSFSFPLCDACHCSVPPVLLWASLCRSFQVCASLCRSATPKAVLIIMRNWSLMPKSRMNTTKAGIPYPTVTTYTSSQHYPPY